MFLFNGKEFKTLAGLIDYLISDTDYFDMDKSIDLCDQADDVWGVVFEGATYTPYDEIEYRKNQEDMH